jgi:LysR family glycine cleavage system transcriptional activator
MHPVEARVSRRLPTLTALRAFEAAARHLSFTRAAEELFVTQAAVSRQVRELESWLGRPLFRRQHRQVRLTQDGVLLAEHLTGSFDELARVIQSVRDPGSTSLHVSVEPALAARWLVPRLGRFRARHPTVELSLSSSAAVARVGAEADLAIRWSLDRTAWRGATASLLGEVEAFPVLAPSLRASTPGLDGPADLARCTLLFEDDRGYWSRWFAEAGLDGVHLPRGPVFNDAALAIEAAVRGEGVALGEPALAADDLAAGRLVRPFAPRVRLGAYWLVMPPHGAGAPAAAFAEWVREEMEATLDGFRRP